METKNANTLIPAERMAHVAAVIEKTFGQAATDIVLLKGGLSGAGVYKIIVKDLPYVLKLDKSNEQDIYATTKMAAAAGLAPEIYYADHKQGISIAAFIDAKPIRTSFADPAALVQSLGKLIRDIHRMPLFEKTSDMRAMVDGFIAQFKASQVLTGVVFDEGFQHYEKIRNTYPWHDADKVSSHNDLNPNNILYDGQQIRVIDWDAAFANDRYVDLAIAAISFANSVALENTLLEAYFGPALNDYHRARFFLMRQTCRIIYAMLMFQLAGASIKEIIEQQPASLAFTMADIGRLAQAGQFDITNQEGQFYYGIALFNEALLAMRSAQLEEAIFQVQKVKV